MLPYFAMILWLILATLLGQPAPFGGPPWDKPPDQWTQADAYRILQDSPWSPAEIKIDAKATLRHTDRQTGLVTEPVVDTYNTRVVPGVQISREKPLPPLPVLWWSSRTVRLAQQRLQQLRNAAKSPGPLRADALPDYVLVIEGSEPVRILQDAKEDLRDTVFLELPEGATLDLGSVMFVEETEEQSARAEFHFPRQIDGRETLNPNTERVLFHCRATAKAPRPSRSNAISLRAQFNPRAMRLNSLPDL